MGAPASLRAPSQNLVHYSLTGMIQQHDNDDDDADDAGDAW